MINIIELATKAEFSVMGNEFGPADVDGDAKNLVKFAALYRQALIDSGELVEADRAKADAVDAERWRKGLEDNEFPICRDGVYMHVCRTTGQIITGNSFNEVIDRARSS